MACKRIKRSARDLLARTLGFFFTTNRTRSPLNNACPKSFRDPSRFRRLQGPELHILWLPSSARIPRPRDMTESRMSWVHFLDHYVTTPGLASAMAEPGDANLLAAMAMTFIVFLSPLVVPGSALTWLGKRGLPALAMFLVKVYLGSKLREIARIVCRLLAPNA
jgi:hypothetical protein